jgi:dCMP deaminase
MFIGIAGPICAGKRSIAAFLIHNHGFTRLRLRHPHRAPNGDGALDALDTPADDAVNGLADGVRGMDVADVWFESMGEMVEFVTKRWREHFVTVDIWTEEDLEVIAKRPFFLLISVDAPISVRWNRFNKRSLPSHNHPQDSNTDCVVDVLNAGNRCRLLWNLSRTRMLTSTPRTE